MTDRVQSLKDWIAQEGRKKKSGVPVPKTTHNGRGNQANVKGRRTRDYEEVGGDARPCPLTMSHQQYNYLDTLLCYGGPPVGAGTGRNALRWRCRSMPSNGLNSDKTASRTSIPREEQQ
jgi:hypothetical protein